MIVHVILYKKTKNICLKTTRGSILFGKISKWESFKMNIVLVKNDFKNHMINDVNKKKKRFFFKIY